MLNITYFLLRRLPHLKREMKKAHKKETPEKFIKKVLKLSMFAAICILVLGFFVIKKAGLSPALLIPLPVVAFVLIFIFLLKGVKVAIRKRRREIDKEVLFAGRYLLVKLESGAPLFNALIDASKSYGICSKYFKEIVEEIQVGTPIEETLEKAREFNASEKFKLILSELLTTLTTGADVTESLKSVLQQITNEQVIEIKTYAKKVNAIILLYMVLGTVMPSLGMTMFIIVAGFLGLELPAAFIFFALMMLVFVQFIFLALFKSARPMVNL